MTTSNLPCRADSPSPPKPFLGPPHPPKAGLEHTSPSKSSPTPHSYTPSSRYELADGRGWINDLTPTVMSEIMASSVDAHTVHIPYEKRTILIDESSLLTTDDASGELTSWDQDLNGNRREP